MNRSGTQHNYISYIANCMCSLLSYIAPRTPAVYGATLVGMHPHIPFPVVVFSHGLAVQLLWHLL